MADDASRERAIAAMRKLTDSEPAKADEFRKGVVSRIAADGTMWVLLSGDAQPSPCIPEIAAITGDTVTVRVTPTGRAYVMENQSSPAVTILELDTVDKVAQRAQQDADAANQAASAAQDSADAAARSASSAQGYAQDALREATSAASYANSALTQLSVVEDVVGVLDWAREHATFVQTSDTEIVPGKVYWTRSGSGTAADPYVYDPVVNPTESGLPSYYEVSVVDAMGEYVSSHLALTNEGLYVVKDNAGYRVLLSNTGMQVQDTLGNVVASFGEDISFDPTREHTIGNQTSYIRFYDSDDDGIADSIAIKADSMMFSSGTDVEEALQDAMDGAFLQITSTNGNLFKNGSESTILKVIVFPNGGDKCETIAQVRTRFGSSAYIEWKWMHESSGTWGTMSSDDAHLSQGGMWCTVTPSDVATKTTFGASLIVP